MDQKTKPNDILSPKKLPYGQTHPNTECSWLNSRVKTNITYLTKVTKEGKKTEKGRMVEWYSCHWQQIYKEFATTLDLELRILLIINYKKILALLKDQQHKSIFK